MSNSDSKPLTASQQDFTPCYTFTVFDPSAFGSHAYLSYWDPRYRPCLHGYNRAKACGFLKELVNPGLQLKAGLDAPEPLQGFHVDFAKFRYQFEESFSVPFNNDYVECAIVWFPPTPNPPIHLGNRITDQQSLQSAVDITLAYTPEYNIEIMVYFPQGLPSVAKPDCQATARRRTWLSSPCGDAPDEGMPTSYPRNGRIFSCSTLPLLSPFFMDILTRQSQIRSLTPFDSSLAPLSDASSTVKYEWDSQLGLIHDDESACCDNLHSPARVDRVASRDSLISSHGLQFTEDILRRALDFFDHKSSTSDAEQVEEENILEGDEDLTCYDNGRVVVIPGLKVNLTLAEAITVYHLLCQQHSSTRNSLIAASEGMSRPLVAFTCMVVQHRVNLAWEWHSENALGHHHGLSGVGCIEDDRCLRLFGLHCPCHPHSPTHFVKPRNGCQIVLLPPLLMEYWTSSFDQYVSLTECPSPGSSVVLVVVTDKEADHSTSMSPQVLRSLRQNLRSSFRQDGKLVYVSTRQPSLCSNHFILSTAKAYRESFLPPFTVPIAPSGGYTGHTYDITIASI
ncbi:hypothetical protein HYALB_00000677 [Hymenoscyphus albidus]|uniref:Uncharacterized protein n=1 Tax=Hymenoscyphus albidus TaxID=595503 RepID=A0A9N9LPD1_9HELO|nr:hypothetical protein HYALB_00000677 [Hymenoscyphus albidus]